MENKTYLVSMHTVLFKAFVFETKVEALTEKGAIEHVTAMQPAEVQLEIHYGAFELTAIEMKQTGEDE